MDDQSGIQNPVGGGPTPQPSAPPVQEPSAPGGGWTPSPTPPPAPNPSAPPVQEPPAGMPSSGGGTPPMGNPSSGGINQGNVA